MATYAKTRHDPSNFDARVLDTVQDVEALVTRACLASLVESHASMSFRAKCAAAWGVNLSATIRVLVPALQEAVPYIAAFQRRVPPGSQLFAFLAELGARLDDSCLLLLGLQATQATILFDVLLCVLCRVRALAFSHLFTRLSLQVETVLVSLEALHVAKA